MYMSKEMLDFQEKDDRYRYCLDRLAKMQDRPMIYEIIERRELTKVHEFDYFYEDFRKVISHIYETMDDSDTLLLNVSSGTPAMKSGLLVLQRRKRKRRMRSWNGKRRCRRRCWISRKNMGRMQS